MISNAKPFLRHLLRVVSLRLLHVDASYTPAIIERMRQRHLIVCANHVSYLDGLLIALTSPIPLVFAVDTDYSRRSSIARQGLALLTWMGFGTVVPIDAHSPFGLRSLRAALDRGDAVMIFPEGSISSNGHPQPVQQGTAWLTSKTGAAVVNIRILGAERSRVFAKSGCAWWPRITIEY